MNPNGKGDNSPCVFYEFMLYTTLYAVTLNGKGCE